MKFETRYSDSETVRQIVSEFLSDPAVQVLKVQAWTREQISTGTTQGLDRAAITQQRKSITGTQTQARGFDAFLDKVNWQTQTFCEVAGGNAIFIGFEKSK